jgi:hypothetical protein
MVVNRDAIRWGIGVTLLSPILSHINSDNDYPRLGIISLSLYHVHV